MESSNVTKLTQHEAAILELLQQRKGEVVTTAEIMSALYSRPEKIQPASNTVQVFVSRLRKKIDATVQITALRGKGYRLDEVMLADEVAA